MDYTKVFTPDSIADLMVLLCNPYEREGSWLEPSAGKGAISFAIRRRFNITQARLTSIEPNKEYFDYLWYNVAPTLSTFENFNPKNRFDFIVANPPFEDGIWMSHLEKMYTLLNPGGTMVSIAPDKTHLKESPYHNEHKRYLDFALQGRTEFIFIENWYKPEKYPIHIIKKMKPLT